MAVNVGGNILAQYNAKSGETALNPTTGINDSTLTRDFSATPELAYINALNPTQTQYQSLDEVAQSWDQTTRGLTETGTAVVAVAAVAATIATAGAAGAAVGAAASAGATAVGASAAVAATVGTMVAAGTAVAITTAAATFAVSATNASLNADNLSNVDDVAKTSVKETTSKDSLKNIAIASVTAALTAGIAEVSGLNDAVRAADAANAAGNTTTMATQMKIALAESAISNTTSTLVQSAISNDSSSDMIKNLATNIAIGAFSNVAAKQIGAAAHAGDISKPEQLALHAGLGATTAALTGNDALSGAVSGVVGEMTAEFADKNTNLSDSAIKELAGVAGGLSSIITGEFSGQNDHEVAQNVWSGSRIGSNAAENNYLSPKEKGDLVKELKACNGDQSCQTQVQAKYEEISNPRDEEFKQAYKACDKDGQCDALKAIHYDLRQKWTEEGNEYFWTHLGEFKLLDSDKSIYHSFELDKNGNPQSTFGRNDNIKYVHPIMGYEVVIDQNNQIVTDPVNMGTYNFYNPNMGIGNPLIEDKYKTILGGVIGNHKTYDVNPYEFLGNKENPTYNTDIISSRKYEFFNPIINSND